MTDREATINKIRQMKKMTMENGCTENEELVARTKVREIMAAHGITEADVENTDTFWSLLSSISFNLPDEEAWERYLRAQGKWESFVEKKRKQQEAQQELDQKLREYEQNIDQAWADRNRSLYDWLVGRRGLFEPPPMYDLRDMEQEQWNFMKAYKERWWYEDGRRGRKVNRDKIIIKVRKMFADAKTIEDQAKAHAVMDYHKITEAEMGG
jgi:hypothetical protein